MKRLFKYIERCLEREAEKDAERRNVFKALESEQERQANEISLEKTDKNYG